MSSNPGIWLAWWIVLVAGCGEAGAQPALRATVDAVNARFTAALAAGRAADLAALYTADAQVFPPGGALVKGQSAIQVLWQGVLDSGIKTLSLATSDVDASGDLILETGTFAMKDAAGRVVDRGKYLVVWKRVQSQWKVHRDIWNATPAAAP